LISLIYYLILVYYIPNQKYLMEKWVITLMSFMINVMSGIAQENLQVSDTFTIEELVEDVLVSGACLNIQNVKVIGDGDGIGYFKFDGEAPLHQEGVLLTTGFINGAIGPNESSNTSGDRYGSTTDKDLDLVATRELYDVTGIEFDFVPFDSIVQFSFQFASEEYCEYVGKEFNDVFGFFVSGPGINGPYADNAINLAVIPSSSEAVSVNTVNPVSNRELYISSSDNGDLFKCGFQIFQKSYQNELEFDGFTLPINPVFSVIPCEKYHIRLVIGDVADRFLDSGVFLERSSFKLGGEVIVDTQVVGSEGEEVQEGCGEANFVFTRSNPIDNKEDLNFIASISSSSSAQRGIDYEDIRLDLTIPASQSSISWPVKTILDKEYESTEDIMIELELPCKCSAVQTQLKILDTPPLVTSIESPPVCKGLPTVFKASNFGGIGPFNYLWDTGEDTDSITRIISSNSKLKVQVSDFCGQRFEREIEIFPIDGPTATIDGITEICDVQGNHFLPITFSGEAPWEFTYTFDEQSVPLSTSTFNSNFQLPVEKPGEYTLISVYDKNCIGVVSGLGFVEKPTIGLKLKDCNSTQSGQVEFEFTGRGAAEFSVNAGASFLPIESLRNLEVDKEYRILLRDSVGCTNWQTLLLPPPVGFKLFVPSLLVKYNHTVQLIPEFNFSEGFIKEITWMPEIGLSCMDCLNPEITVTETENYKLIIEDFFGCIHEAEFEIKVDLMNFYVPNVFSPYNNDGINDKLLVYPDDKNTKEIKSFDIFDRWGNQLYGESNFSSITQKGWNGLIKGKKVNSGVLVYRIVVELLDGRLVEGSGDITIVN
jgi:gliding motility-associated-like protein